MPDRKKKKEQKKENRKYSYKECRKVVRPDGMMMKTVRGYTFPDFIDAVSHRFGNRVCYKVFRTGEENDTTFSQLGWHAYAIASYLISKGIEKGDRIAIFGESCPGWMEMYLGITSIGAVAVPILPDFSSAEAMHIISESGAKGVCVNQKQFQKISSIVSDLMVFRMEDLVHVPSISEEYQFGTAPGFPMRNAKINPAELEKRKPAEGDVASLIFTSGTTGASKGVVLTHMNILRCADLATDIYVKIKPGYRALSILPMSHVYEFTIGQILPLMVGVEITFLGRPPAVSVLLPALSEVRPHVMLTVPLLIEKVYKAAVLPVLRDNKKISSMLNKPIIGSFVYRTIGKKLMKTFGHNLVFFGIGGAPLDKDVELFLHKAHFPYAIGYGLTETSPLVAGCGSAHSRQHPGFVGEIVTDDDVILLPADVLLIEADVDLLGVGLVRVRVINQSVIAYAAVVDGAYLAGIKQLDKALGKVNLDAVVCFFWHDFQINVFAEVEEAHTCYTKVRIALGRAIAIVYLYFDRVSCKCPLVYRDGRLCLSQCG